MPRRLLYHWGHSSFSCRTFFFVCRPWFRHGGSCEQFLRGALSACSCWHCWLLNPPTPVFLKTLQVMLPLGPAVHTVSNETIFSPHIQATHKHAQGAQSTWSRPEWLSWPFDEERKRTQNCKILIMQCVSCSGGFKGNGYCQQLKLWRPSMA